LLYTDFHLIYVFNSGFSGNKICCNEKERFTNLKSLTSEYVIKNIFLKKNLFLKIINYYMYNFIKIFYKSLYL